MDVFETYERVILRTLYSSEQGVDAYYFHERYKISPGQILSFVNRFNELGASISSDFILKFNLSARAYVWKNRHKIFNVSNRRKWRKGYYEREWSSVEVAESLSPHYMWVDKQLRKLSRQQLKNLLMKG